MLFNKKMAFYAAAIFFIVIDRLLKSLALSKLATFRVVGDFFSFSFVPNSYIAFSIPLGGWILNIIVSFIVLYFLFLWLRNKNNAEGIGYFFVVIGAMSNLYDRFRFGFVIDYLDLKYFTVFNLADLLICAGVILLILTRIKK